MKKIIFILLTYIFISINSNLIAENNDKKLKIGLLAPLSGNLKNLGESILFSVLMGLEQIGDNNVIVIPKDSGSGNKEVLKKSISEIKNEGAKVIIGPINNYELEDAKKYKDLIFISPSNINPSIEGNIISIGISLESQLLAIENFLRKKKVKKTILMYPENNYTGLIEEKIKKSDYKYYKSFKYNPDPKVLTGEIEKLTNYNQRKRNLEIRKKMLENKDDLASKRELEILEQKYTLGNINFDSVVVIDFGNSLKSLLTSLIFADVDQTKVIFTTVNQWFDKSIFYENTLKELYYPSIDYESFKKYNKAFTEKFKEQPSELTILTHDALGLIYYIWKKNNKSITLKDFYIKEKIKGKIGRFSFKNNEVLQDLNIYVVKNKKFIKF